MTETHADARDYMLVYITKKTFTGIYPSALEHITDITSALHIIHNMHKRNTFRASEYICGQRPLALQNDHRCIVLVDVA